MTTDYYRFSQRMREEILQDEGLLQRIEEIIPYQEKENNAYFLGSGCNNTVWMIGRTSTGVDVALRQSKSQQRDYGRFCGEVYGRTAEWLAQEQRRVSRFTIGVKHPSL